MTKQEVEGEVAALAMRIAALPERSSSAMVVLALAEAIRRDCVDALEDAVIVFIVGMLKEAE